MSPRCSKMHEKSNKQHIVKNTHTNNTHNKKEEKNHSIM